MPKDQNDVEDGDSANQDKNLPTVFQFEPEGVHAYIQVKTFNGLLFKLISEHF